MSLEQNGLGRVLCRSRNTVKVLQGYSFANETEQVVTQSIGANVPDEFLG
jgi:hypothetical protein